MDQEDKVEMEEPSSITRYHHLIIRNKHILSEIKLSVVIVIGSIVIVACLVYIVIQCRTKGNAARAMKNRRADDEEELFDSSDTTEQLLPQPPDNAIRLKVRREPEFYVWLPQRVWGGVDISGYMLRIHMCIPKEDGAGIFEE